MSSSISLSCGAYVSWASRREKASLVEMSDCVFGVCCVVLFVVLLTGLNERVSNV